MTENFITRISVNKSRYIKDLDIPLCETQRQHLIFTGKNGSGKTSLLLEIKTFLQSIDSAMFDGYKEGLIEYKKLKNLIEQSDNIENEKLRFESNIKNYERWYNTFGGSEIFFSGTEKEVIEKYKNGRFILAFFDAKRNADLAIPTGINKVNLQRKYRFGDNASINFLQYIVNLIADRSFARDDRDFHTVNKIDKWFNNLENRLKSIFDVEDLELRFDRKNYNFKIIIDKGEPFGFNTLSAGYSAIINIITEILLRMEAYTVKSYDIEGVVIIDEIETHLHVELQKKILPFLVDFFPKIQFIITTHSPFVLSSLSNATICDLETKIVTNDLSGYSYDALIESYFKTDKYSEEVKNKILEFENLIAKKEKNYEEKERTRFLRNYFAHIPKYLSTELLVKLQQIELIELNNK